MAKKVSATLNQNTAVPATPSQHTGISGSTGGRFQGNLSELCDALSAPRTVSQSVHKGARALGQEPARTHSLWNPVMLSLAEGGRHGIRTQGHCSTVYYHYSLGSLGQDMRPL